MPPREFESDALLAARFGLFRAVPNRIPCECPYQIGVPHGNPPEGQDSPRTPTPAPTPCRSSSDQCPYLADDAWKCPSTLAFRLAQSRVSERSG